MRQDASAFQPPADCLSSPIMTLRLALLVALLGASACSSTENTPAAGDAASEAASEAAVDSGAVDAPVAETGDPRTCVVKRAAKTADCAEDCDARLFLPGGDAFCTLMCSTNADCAKYGADLVCSSGTGTCMPKCTADSSCTTAGFKRCDADAGACDTI